MNELVILTTREIVGLDDTDVRTLPKDLKEFLKIKWVSVESLKKLKGSSITTVYGLLKELEKYD